MIIDYYNVSAAIYGTATNAVELQGKHRLLLGEFDSLHWYCQPCDTVQDA